MPHLAELCDQARPCPARVRHQAVVEREQPPDGPDVGAGVRGETGARELEDPLALPRGRQLDADDIERVTSLVAQRGPAAVAGRRQTLQGAAQLELVQRHQGSLLELTDHPSLERAMHLEAAGGWELVERQEALQQFPKVDRFLLHRASLPPSRAAQLHSRKPQVFV